MATIHDILDTSPLPRQESELLLAFLLSVPIETVLTHPETAIDSWRKKKFFRLANRRLSGQPLAYLLGYKYFYDLKLSVNRHTLVPRPETETIVDLVLEELANIQRPIQFVDIGSGSGAIILALASKIKERWPDLFKSCFFWGTDISRKALRIARLNCKRYGLPVRFCHGNLFNPVSRRLVSSSPVIIMANLPYLTPLQIRNSFSIQAEPEIALNGGKDGLDSYRQLFRQLTARSAPSLIFCEIDPSQKTAMEEMIISFWPKAKITTIKDVRDDDRIIKIAR